MLKELLRISLVSLAMIGIAAGRLPRLRMNRASIALAFSALLVGTGCIDLDSALGAIDVGTIVLLLAMMLLVANLRIAGFFLAAGSRILAAARSPRALLALVIAASGFLSALFLNDTICLMLTPLVVELSLRSRRNPVPYLIGLAVSANIGSCATLIGNPQNMLIGAASGISFGRFLAMLGPPSLLGMLLSYAGVVAAYPEEFRAGGLPMNAGSSPSFPPEAVDRRLAAKSLASALIMVVLLFAGSPPPLAALVAASVLLFTTRISPERVFAEVDFGLLVFFGGLFIITRSVAEAPLFSRAVDAARPLLSAGGPASLAALSASAALASNLVSNVPTVMLMIPLVPGFAEPERAYLVLALASTFAGNLTLLGSVANLIVAERAKSQGVELSFGAYLKVGLPLTLATVAAGTVWLTLLGA